MAYRVECETMEGETIVLPAATLEAAKREARTLSRKHIIAYAVFVEDGEAVGHVVFGEGFQCEQAGKLWECN
jgi:CRISPR/Cas system type I-B associated protein Csh2 (Cas7 group RAMP superfamily)